MTEQFSENPEQFTPPDSTEWLKHEAYGDERLLQLLEWQDDFMRKSDLHDEDDQLARELFKKTIRERQAELGLDPAEGPDYPSGE